MKINNAGEEVKLTIESERFNHLFPNYSDKSSNGVKIKLNGSASISFNSKSYTVNNIKNKNYLDSKIQAITFFSGAGGLDIGAQLANTKVISSLDFDRDSVASIRQNQYFVHAEHNLENIASVSSKDYASVIAKNNPEKLVLLGGPPCQPFSKAGYWKTNELRLGNEDPRNMIGQYLRMINEVRPDGFILENVESLLHPSNKIAMAIIEEALIKMSYNYKIVRANSADYGVPQKRKRVFVIASKKKFKFEEPVKTHGNEKERLLNPNLLPYENVLSWIGKYDVPRFAVKEDSTEGKYHSDLLEVSPGKNYIDLTARNNYPDPKFIAGKRYWSFLLKLHPLEPSWTIISQPGHWEGPFHWTSRRLRLEELAAIQTFPEDYVFSGSRRSVQKQIGNAVPPLLGKAMVEFLMSNI